MGEPELDELELLEELLEELAELAVPPPVGEPLPELEQALTSSRLASATGERQTAKRINRDSRQVDQVRAVRRHLLHQTGRTGQVAGAFVGNATGTPCGVLLRLGLEIFVQFDRIALFAHPDIDQFDPERERHGEINIALGHVDIEPFHHQGEAHHHQE